LEAELVSNFGIKGDAHAGNWHRQVSLLSREKIEEFRARGAKVKDGAFGENLVVEGINLSILPIGTHLRSGGILLELTQIGKNEITACAIYKAMGDCSCRGRACSAGSAGGTLTRETSWRLHGGT
jgi:TatD DNase family protein